MNDCPLCFGKTKYQYRITRFTPAFDIHKCLNCGLLFQHPFPKESDLQALYSKDYYQGKAQYSYEDERQSIPHYNEVWKKRLEVIIKWLKPLNPKEQNLKFLDIGCSFGGLLSVAKDYHFQTYGVDISIYAREYCEKNTPHTVKKDLLEYQEKESFKAITMIELIEHITNPKTVLSHCYDLLTNDGVLVIQTANFRSLQAKLWGKHYEYFLPGHVCYFSYKNLKDLLKSLGFKKIKIYQPVEFGLKAKLLKSKGQFKKWYHYLKWIKISLYHMLSYIKIKNFSLTASMVIYAKK